MDAVEMHRRSVARAAEVVAGIGDDQWHDPTPCTEWDVEDLVAHNVIENRWVLPLLDGATVEEVGDSLDRAPLGDDPVGIHNDSGRAAQAKIEDTDLTRTVHLSFGDVTAEFYVQQRATDLVVHAWDLAVATGQDAAMGEEVAEAAYEASRPLLTPEVRESSPFGPEVEVGDDAPWSHRLLGLLGRDPAAPMGSSDGA